MALVNNNAFAGAHTVKDREFRVVYAGKATLAIWNAGKPRNHHDNAKAGWYFEIKRGLRVGPFTSSRKAYINACDWIMQKGYYAEA